nr:hydroxylysine kinase-like [Ciona intestinalis]|eukprot:XP_026692890.1 hydroxylysine kinase-like [Ciona intestinalis]
MDHANESGTFNESVLNLSCEDVADAVKTLYNVTVKSVKKLYGYDDLNFRINSHNESFVLKVKQQKYDGASQQAVLTKKIMKHLNADGFRVPVAVTTINGKDVTASYVFGDNKTQRQLEMFTYLPGKSILELKLSPEILVDTARDVGVLFGSVTKSLEKLNNLLSIENYVVSSSDIWQTQNFPQVRSYLHFVKDKNLNMVICEVFDAFAAMFPSLKKQLNRGLIHGDFSTTNIIVEKLGQEMGVIDFEDSTLSYRVFDLSVCIGYMMVSALDVKADPMLLIKNLYQGYASVASPLNSGEKEILFVAVQARLATSYIMSRYTLSLHPENEKYLDWQSSKCPKLLLLLHSKGKEQTLREWGVLPH